MQTGGWLSGFYAVWSVQDASFTFLPDVPVDHAAASEVLSRYICDPQNKLALIIGKPNKDEYGHFIAGDFDPIANAMDGGSMGKRMRVQRDLGSDGSTVLPLRTTTSAAPKRQRHKPAAPKQKQTTTRKKGSNSKNVRSSICFILLFYFHNHYV